MIQETGDYLKLALLSVVESTKKDNAFLDEIKTKGKPWKGVIEYFKQKLPQTIDISERDNIAGDNMKFLLNSIFGEGNWKGEKRPMRTNPMQTTTWVVLSK